MKAHHAPRAALLFLALALPIAAACKDEQSPPEKAPPASPSQLASALNVDASLLEPAPTDPAAPVGNLRDEIERFTTVDACVKARSNVDPLLGDALDAIGYDTFVVDSCRILDALKDKSTKKCAPIDSSMLRMRCERLASIAAGDADACPFAVAGKPAFGRDPTCVAAAARDPRLCAGENALERAACTALVGKDEKACASQPREQDRARCARFARRYAPLIEAGEAKGAPFTKPAAHLTLTPLEGTPDAGAGDIDVTDDAARGVVLVDSRLTQRFEIGDFREGSYGFIAPTPVSRPHLAIAFESLAGAKTTRAERSELAVPGVAALVAPPSRAELKVTVDKLEKLRGGAVHVVVDGEIGVSGRGYKIHLEVTTFVRDVVSGSALAAATSPGFGLGLPGTMPSSIPSSLASALRRADDAGARAP